MAHSRPQLTRALASDVTDLEPVESVKSHDGSVGSVTFDVCSALSGNRVSKLLPDGWKATLVVTDASHTVAYIEQE